MANPTLSPAFLNHDYGNVHDRTLDSITCNLGNLLNCQLSTVSRSLKEGCFVWQDLLLVIVNQTWTLQVQDLIRPGQA